MASAWYLDAWDVSGGRAFASWREPLPPQVPEELDLRTLCGEGAVLIRPPSFEVERLASPAIGLAAGRSGSFLQRVEVREDGAEIGFSSIEDIAELVRRAFIANGSDGERGPPEGGRTPPLMPQPGEVLAEWGADVQMLAFDLSGYCDRFRMTTFISGETTTEPTNSVTLSAKTEVPDDLIVLGALTTAHALLQQAPRATSALEWSRWRFGAAGLADVIDSLGVGLADLSPTLRAFARAVLESWIDSQDADGRVQLRKELGSVDSAGFVPLIVVLLRGYPRDWGALERVGLRMLHWVDWNQIAARRESDPFVATQFFRDRFESLQWWPCVDVGSGRDVRPASLQDLLSAYVGAPGSFANAPAEVHGQMLLVAAFLSLRNGVGVSLGEAANAARAWLDRSMPRRVFDQAIEQLIAGRIRVVDSASTQVEGAAF